MAPTTAVESSGIVAALGWPDTIEASGMAVGLVALNETEIVGVVAAVPVVVPAAPVAVVAGVLVEVPARGVGTLVTHGELRGVVPATVTELLVDPDAARVKALGKAWRAPMGLWRAWRAPTLSRWATARTGRTARKAAL